MTIEDRPSSAHLRAQLLHAGEEEPFETDGLDPRRKTFEKLVRRIDHALGGGQVLYATHAFTDPDALDLPLRGLVVAFTSSLVAMVRVSPGSDPRVTVIPLRSLSDIIVEEHDEARFLGANSWKGLRVTLHFDSQKSTSLHLPGAPSSDTNALEFDAFYPTLLDALKGR
jgi:hypothetical protein